MVADDLTPGDVELRFLSQGQGAVIGGGTAFAVGPFAGSPFRRDVAVVHRPEVTAHGRGNGHFSSAVVDAEIGQLGGEVEGAAGGGAPQGAAHGSRHDQQGAASRIHFPRRPGPVEECLAGEVAIKLVEHFHPKVG